MTDHDHELRRLVDSPSAAPEPLELISTRARTRRRHRAIGAGLGLGSVVAVAAVAVLLLPDSQSATVEYGSDPAASSTTAPPATVTSTSVPEILISDCGTSEMGHLDDAGYYITYPPFECILDAFEAGRPATLTHLLTTVEGDPIENRLVIDADGELTVFVDTTADRFGPQVITEQRCTELSVVEVDLVWDGCTNIQIWDVGSGNPIPSTTAQP